MYLCSSALIFFIDWDFSLGHMSMDMPSVLAALSSPMVSSVTGTGIQVASPQGCTPGLAGPEPSGPLNYPGPHLHGSRGYLNVVPAGPIPSLAPQGIPVNTVGPQEAMISLPLCCATEALRGFPCSSPECSRRSRIPCRGGHQDEDPIGHQPPHGWNQPADAAGGGLQEPGGTATTHMTPLENLEVNMMDFKVGGPGEVPPPTRPEQWAPWEPRLCSSVRGNGLEVGCSDKVCKMAKM